MGSDAQHNQQQPKSVDLVHLAQNIGEYSGWDGNKWKAFIALAIPGDEKVTYEEAQLCVYHCLKTDLNPLHKEIYFIRRKGKLTPQVSITGFHKMAHDTKAYRGMVPVEWCGQDKVWTDVWDAKKDGVPLAARAGVLHRDFSEPFYAVAVFSEYYPEHDNQAFMWKKMPAHMIAKCAKALALREVFPSLSGYYTEDEMDQSRPDVQVRVEETPREPQRQQKQKPKAKKVSEKTKRYRYLISKVKKKFPSLKNDEDINEWIRRFADKRELLTVCPDKKRGSISASSLEQIENLIKAVQQFDPQAQSQAEQPVPDEEPEEAEYTMKPITDDQLLEQIEKYEAHLSQIPAPDDRDDWQRKALACAPADKIGPLKDGLPVVRNWTSVHLRFWCGYLENIIAQEAKL